MQAVQPVPFFDLKRQYAALEADLLQRIQAFLPTQMLTGGPELDQFEAAAASYLGVEHAIACSNGTDALVLALMALDIGPGDEVIVPAFTFFCTGSVVARAGARPVFVDVCPETFNVTPEAVAAAVTPHTRALMPVHLFGQAFDVVEMQALAAQHSLPLIEDAAQAFGATWRDDKCGSFGEIGCYSFYPTKNIGALGEGGMISCQKADLARKLRALRSQGSERRYEHLYLGGNFRLASIQALTLRLKLEHLDNWIELRRTHARQYHAALSGVGDLVLPAARPDRLHTYNQYVIRSSQRDALRAHLQADGIGTDIYYPSTVPAQPVFASLGHKAGEFPHAEAACREVLALPIFPELTEAEVQRVSDSIRRFF